MQFLTAPLRTTPEAFSVYWMLARIIVPITIGTELLSRLGVIEAVAPAFSPILGLIGLPPALGLAWVMAMLVGLWGAVPLLFTLHAESCVLCAHLPIPDIGTGGLPAPPPELDTPKENPRIIDTGVGCAVDARHSHVMRKTQVIVTGRSDVCGYGLRAALHAAPSCAPDCAHAGSPRPARGPS